MKTAELTGAALDWAVAHFVEMSKPFPIFIDGKPQSKGDYSTNWAQGGPIIEREQIFPAPTNWGGDQATAFVARENKATPRAEQYGPTPLIAAMRCFVASKLGDEVEVPEGLV